MEIQTPGAALSQSKQWHNGTLRKPPFETVCRQIQRISEGDGFHHKYAL
ncbi:MAG: hypothetical protein ACYC6Q_11480 [Syntrophales bacterium]